ncbi:hypothetical protein [Urechidicola vernalis]|uniref:Lipoprotein n=1 Tax=Urechidicola vernalis TaxID=3075600 RepID=A0ABU2Y704_9FLAO|nr:hypothetical protein [Urechidicola sp. P050]MDT0553000.1 hypothetical protein [Urechidicola sp. P050]
MNKFLVLCFLLLVSCKSYQIDADSLQSQLQKTTPVIDSLSEGRDITFFKGENLEELIVLNGNGEKVVLKTDTPIVLKVTRKDGFKFRYYLNSMSLFENEFKGMGPTYLVGGMIHKVKVDSIASIKVKP